MRTSDLIAKFILDLLDEKNGICEIQRSELASLFSCVPSQINYVISTRFSPEYGYSVESRRGGGGYIKITRVEGDDAGRIMHIVNFVGDALSAATAQIFIQNMVNEGILNPPEAKIMLAALSEGCFAGLAPKDKDILRARIFKNMLLSL